MTPTRRCAAMVLFALLVISSMPSPGQNALTIALSPTYGDDYRVDMTIPNGAWGFVLVRAVLAPSGPGGTLSPAQVDFIADQQWLEADPDWQATDVIPMLPPNLSTNVLAGPLAIDPNDLAAAYLDIAGTYDENRVRAYAQPGTTSDPLAPNGSSRIRDVDLYCQSWTNYVGGTLPANAAYYVWEGRLSDATTRNNPDPEMGTWFSFEKTLYDVLAEQNGLSLLDDPVVYGTALDLGLSLAFQLFTVEDGSGTAHAGSSDNGTSGLPGLTSPTLTPPVLRARGVIVEPITVRIAVTGGGGYQLWNGQPFGPLAEAGDLELPWRGIAPPMTVTVRRGVRTWTLTGSMSAAGKLSCTLPPAAAVPGVTLQILQIGNTEGSRSGSGETWEFVTVQ